MTRQEYLQELKEELKTLLVEEQEEALEYYRNYFEDADNDQAVMEELGSPQKLAAEIKEKFAGVPAVQENQSQDGSYGNFDNTKVKSLDISIGIAEVVMAAGDCFSVDFRGMAKGDIRYGLSPFGTFSIENNRKLPDFSTWKRESKNHPRILIKVPPQTKLDILRLHVGAGSFISKGIDIQVARSYIDVGAGLIDIKTILGGAAEMRCGMGKLSYEGTVSGLVKASCGMGMLSLNLVGKEEDYSIEAKVGLGSVQFNNVRKNPLGTIPCTEQKQNHFSVQCGMGYVNIQMKEN